MKRTGVIILLATAMLTFTQGEDLLDWTELPQIPDELGVAGPFTGIHEGTLIVAGGANFPAPVWESDKQWHTAIYGLPINENGAKWETLGELPRPLGYGACLSLPDGVLCLGGNDATRVYDSVFLMRFVDGSIEIEESFPPLPRPLCYSAAAMIGTHIYLVGGQTGLGLETAQKTVWRLDWSKRGDEAAFQWEAIDTWPGEALAFSQAVSLGESLFVIGGRHLDQHGKTKFLDDVFEFDAIERAWTRRASFPTAMAAGTAVGIGDERIFLLAGADGSLFEKADDLKDNHPGFPKTIWAFDTKTDRWMSVGTMPQNQVTTHAVKWGDSVFLASGEIRPRVRTPKVWRIAIGP